MNTWLFNPFVYVAGSRALLFGWACMLATAGVAYFSHAHFDGAIDMHLGAAATWTVFLLEQLLAWGSLVLVLYPIGFLLSKSRIRFIDIAGTVALARLPMLIAAFVGFLPRLPQVSPTNINPGLLATALLVLACAIWMIALMYHAFTLSFNLKGSKAVLGFIGGLFIAEILSKVTLTYLFAMQRFFLVLTFFVFSSACFAQTTSVPFNKPKLDSLFTILESNNKAMGAITLSKNGKNFYSRAIGFSNLANKDKNLAATKYRVGSVSKTFTSVMIHQLVEEKKLAYATPLAQFFPQLPNAQAITMDHLLYHRSGLHDFTNDAAYRLYMATPQSKSQMLDRIAAAQPDFSPDEKTAYCNTNYVLLGYIIEAVTKKSYQQNLTTRITQTAGLRNTYYGGKIDLSKGEASSYENKNGTWTADTETDMSIPHGAGAIVSTSGDLATFMQALFSNQLLNKESLRAMTTMKGNFGRGILRFPVNNEYGYWHNGAIDGFRSLIGYIPRDSIAISFAFNGLTYPMTDILMGVVSIYYDQPYTLPSFPPTIKLADLSGYEGLYTSKQNPLRITIRKESDHLVVQAAGQPPFALEAKSETSFHITQLGAVLEFNKSGATAFNQFTLKQNGAQFLFEKQ